MGAKMRLYGVYTQNLARFGEVIGKTPKSAHILTPKNAQIRGLLPYDPYIPYAGVLSKDMIVWRPTRVGVTVGSSAVPDPVRIVPSVVPLSKQPQRTSKSLEG